MTGCTPLIVTRVSIRRAYRSSGWSRRVAAPESANLDDGSVSALLHVLSDNGDPANRVITTTAGDIIILESFDPLFTPGITALLNIDPGADSDTIVASPDQPVVLRDAQLLTPGSVINFASAPERAVIFATSLERTGFSGAAGLVRGVPDCVSQDSGQNWNPVNTGLAAAHRIMLAASSTDDPATSQRPVYAAMLSRAAGYVLALPAATSGNLRLPGGFLRGDRNCDGVVNTFDLAIVLNDWGRTTAP